MAETRLQSDMIQNMSRAQRAAMFQRGQIASNQRDWFDYVQTRDGGAFQPSYGGGYLHEEVHPSQRGRTNPYQRYYAAQQARQAEFQRQRFLNAQRFQNQYMIQQQKSQDIQLAEEREQNQTRQERERKLAAVRKQQDAIRNNPELDQNSFEVQNMLKQLDAAAFQAETDLELNPVHIQKIPSGNKDKDNNPIETWIVYQDGKSVTIRDGNKVAENNLAKAKQDALDIHNARTANHNADSLKLDEEKADRSAKEFDLLLPLKRADATNARIRNELTASGQSQDDLKSKFKIADELEEREGKRRAARKAQIERDFAEKVVRGGAEMTDDEFADAMQQRDDAIEALDFGPATPADPGDEYRSERPTGADARDEIERRSILTDPNATEDDLNEQVQYDSPMDSEFSDEQFAGTEPAGLYDPTGQPLPMDGGMYNGFA